MVLYNLWGLFIGVPPSQKTPITGKIHQKIVVESESLICLILQRVSPCVDLPISFLRESDSGGEFSGFVLLQIARPFQISVY